MSIENRSEAQKTDGMSEQASRNTLALNSLVAFRGKDLLDSAGIFFKAMINEPRVATDQWLSFVGELTDIATGKSERAPQVGDKRFADPTWKTSPVHSGLLKAYLAWGEALDNFVSETSLNPADRERAHLFTTILVDALAPTNSLIANPAATRKLIDSGGQSLLSGLKNYIEDLVKNGGLPSQVDMAAFKVGENLAITPGAVVFRNELIELIQYVPTTSKVWKRPLVMTPPQINKFYAMDLSPDKSMVKFLLEQISIGDFRRRIRPSARQFVSKNSTALAHPCGLAGSIEFTLTMPSGALALLPRALLTLPRAGLLFATAQAKAASHERAPFGLLPVSAICSSARRPYALRARDTPPASKMSSQVVLWLSTLLTAHRTWPHWQS